MALGGGRVGEPRWGGGGSCVHNSLLSPVILVTVLALLTEGKWRNGEREKGRLKGRQSGGWLGGGVCREIEM